MPDYAGLCAEWQEMLARRSAMGESLALWTSVLDGWRDWKDSGVVPLTWSPQECLERWERGLALQRGISTTDRILLSTGRVSSEMLLKAARMSVPIVASRTSPTEMAVALAEQLGVTVVGYVRGESFNLYAGEAIALPGAA